MVSWIRRWSPLALAVVMAVQMAWFSREDRQITACQARYNIDVAETTEKRAKIAEEDRENLTDFVRKISSAQTSEDVRESLETYLRTQEELDNRRSRNPIPTLEAGSCK